MFALFIVDYRFLIYIFKPLVNNGFALRDCLEPDMDSKIPDHP